MVGTMGRTGNLTMPRARASRSSRRRLWPPTAATVPIRTSPRSTSKSYHHRRSRRGLCILIIISTSTSSSITTTTTTTPRHSHRRTTCTTPTARHLPGRHTTRPRFLTRLQPRHTRSRLIQRRRHHSRQRMITASVARYPISTRCRRCLRARLVSSHPQQRRWWWRRRRQRQRWVRPAHITVTLTTTSTRRRTPTSRRRIRPWLTLSALSLRPCMRPVPSAPTTRP
jgi:hypothetical protein